MFARANMFALLWNVFGGRSVWDCLSKWVAQNDGFRNSTRPSRWDPEHGKDFSEMRWAWNHGKKKPKLSEPSDLMSALRDLLVALMFFLLVSWVSGLSPQHPNSLRCLPETNLAKWKKQLALTSMNDAELRNKLDCSQTPTSPEGLNRYTYDISWHLMTREYAHGMMGCCTFSNLEVII